jgi:hypothetical protein
MTLKRGGGRIVGGAGDDLDDGDDVDDVGGGARQRAVISEKNFAMRSKPAFSVSSLAA